MGAALGGRATVMCKTECEMEVGVCVQTES